MTLEHEWRLPDESLRWLESHPTQAETCRELARRYAAWHVGTGHCDEPEWAAVEALQAFCWAAVRPLPDPDGVGYVVLSCAVVAREGNALELVIVDEELEQKLLGVVEL